MTGLLPDKPARTGSPTCTVFRLPWSGPLRMDKEKAEMGKRNRGLNANPTPVTLQIYPCYGETLDVDTSQSLDLSCPGKGATLDSGAPQLGHSQRQSSVNRASHHSAHPTARRWLLCRAHRNPWSCDQQHPTRIT